MRILALLAFGACLLGTHAATAGSECLPRACLYDVSDEGCDGDSGATGLRVDSVGEVTGWSACTQWGKADIVLVRLRPMGTVLDVTWWGMVDDPGDNATHLEVFTWSDDVQTRTTWSTGDGCWTETRVSWWTGTAEESVERRAPCPAGVPPPPPPPLPWGRLLP